MLSSCSHHFIVVDRHVSMVHLLKRPLSFFKVVVALAVQSVRVKHKHPCPQLSILEHFASNRHILMLIHYSARTGLDKVLLLVLTLGPELLNLKAVFLLISQWQRIPSYQ